MSNLISGKEALIALANGDEVEYTFSRENWENAKLLQACGFFEDSYQFRLKPKTIIINGVEIPRPFKPKQSEWGNIKIYFLAPEQSNGWAWQDWNEYFDADLIQFGAWRTKEEVKQVVEALRGIFNEH